MEILDAEGTSKRARIKKQSLLGKISFVLGMVIIACLITAMANLFMHLNSGTRFLSRFAEISIAGVMLCSMLGGVITGIIGVVQKTHRRGLAIAGLIISGLMTLFYLLALGFA